jgi:DNA-binding NarL/FixJ family response regulator
MTCPQHWRGAPPTATAPPSGSTGPGAESAATRLRVLVVDDDVRVRAAIAQTIALEADMMVVADAADSANAMASAERTNPAVALVDVLLPNEAAGLALVRNLKWRLGCAVVAMSVRSGLRQAALESGAAAFVEKGSDIDAILNAVRAAGRPLQY